MGCNFPVPCYDGFGEITKRPCGGCIGCRLEKARQWALRCVHEASMHDENSFVTLTYNNENLPFPPSVYKDEMQDFMKRLRHSIYPKKVRFYGCGEYGSSPGRRPHYHILLFGHSFQDQEVLKVRKKRGLKQLRSGGRDIDILYTSKDLGKLWKKGFHTIGEVNFETAGYVARYVSKKVTGKRAKEHYPEGIEPEFALMSRMPGIGATWYEKYRTDVHPKDFVTYRGVKNRPPIYYDYLYKKNDYEGFERIKRERKKKQAEKAYENDLRQVQKENHRRLVTKRLKRSLDYDDFDDVCVL